MKNQKIFIGLLIGLLIILLIVSCFIKDESEKDNNSSISAESIITTAKKESESIKDEEKKALAEINVSEYLTYYSGSEKHIILIARPTCSYCEIALPIIQNIAFENDLDIKYLNTDNFEADDDKKLIESDEYFNEGFGTPTLLIVGENKIIDIVDGLSDKKHYEEFFTKNSYIN